MYLSTKSKWSTGEKIITTIYPAGTLERETFITLVIGFKAEDFLLYYDDQKMRGNMVTKPVSLNNALAVHRFIQKNPGAIGFVNCNDVDTTMVKVLMVQNCSPGEEKYPIRK
jgi:hypothetical protein